MADHLQLKDVDALTRDLVNPTPATLQDLPADLRVRMVETLSRIRGRVLELRAKDDASCKE